MNDIVSAFNLFAKDYDGWFNSPEGSAVFALEIEAVRLIIKDIERPFLEVGVGTGRFAAALGIDYGVDPSSEVLEIAEKRGIKVKKAYGENLPFEDESFGGVFLLFTLCFVENPEKVLSEARRVLKKGGGLIAGIINRESMWGKLYTKKKTEGHHIYKYAQFYSADEVTEMLIKARMEVEAYSSTLCLPPSETHYKEVVHKELVGGAGFVCILARKPL